MKGNLDARQTEIFNSRHLSPVDSVEFCGACHATWWDVKTTGVKGVASTRSAPYRLVTSKCWGKGDARITCIACHDPHEQLQTEPTAYDHACLKCHVTSSGQKTTDGPPWRCLSSSREELHCLPHAEGVCAGDARQVHRPSNSYRARGRSLSQNDWSHDPRKTTSTSPFLQRW